MNRITSIEAIALPEDFKLVKSYRTATMAMDGVGDDWLHGTFAYRNRCIFNLSVCENVSFAPYFLFLSPCCREELQASALNEIRRGKDYACSCGKKYLHSSHDVQLYAMTPFRSQRVTTAVEFATQASLWLEVSMGPLLGALWQTDFTEGLQAIGFQLH